MAPNRQRSMVTLEEKKRVLAKWLRGRPKIIKTLADRFPPWGLYRMVSTGRKVRLYSYSEDGTLTVHVLRAHNPGILFERRVFGIEPDDLVRIPEEGKEKPDG